MNRLKKTLLLSLSFILIASSTVSFATSPIILTLDNAREMAKEQSPVIREIKTKESKIKDQIRSNIQTSYKLANALDKTYDYIQMYEEAVNGGSNNKYLGRSDSYLKSVTGYVNFDPANGSYSGSGLMWKAFMAQAMGNLAAADSIANEIEFIQMYMYFGDNPNVDKTTKYQTFIKNEERLKYSEKLITTQFEEGIKKATNAVDSGVIELFIKYNDALEGLNTKTALHRIQEDGLNNMKISHSKGLVSDIQLENQQYIVEKSKLELHSLALNIEILEGALKKLVGLNLSTPIRIQSITDDITFELKKSPSGYYDTALINNYDYVLTLSNYNYELYNLEVMNRYLPDIDQETKLPVYYQEKEDLKDAINNLKEQLDMQKGIVESNINYAYNDLIIKNEIYERSTKDLKLNELELNSAITSFKLGTITQLKLDQAKLAYQNAIMTNAMNKRAYYSGIERFKLLVNKGTLYE